MARIKFKIGGTPGLHFNFPSREHGNSEVCIGKVTVDSGKLKCSGEFSIDRAYLIDLVVTANSIISSAKGGCRIISKCKCLEIDISATLKGHIRVIANMSAHEFTSPENREWSSSSTFYLYPSAMDEVAASESYIRS